VLNMSGELVPDRRDLRASHDDRDQVVERLRVAAGDGRLTAEELEERLESALTARTYGELERLVADLPAEAGAGAEVAAGSGGKIAPAAAAVPSAPAKELVQLKSHNGNIRRSGPWTVPRRLALESRNGNVSLDLTQAVVTQPTLDIAVNLHNGNFTLVVGPGVSVDLDEVTSRSGNIRQRVHHEPGTPLTLHVSVAGHLRNGNVTVRGPRRGFWAWLLRRGPKKAAA
jgi:hypothetical protein